jgi:hypothetical protein
MVESPTPLLSQQLDTSFRARMRTAVQWAKIVICALLRLLIHRDIESRVKLNWITPDMKSGTPVFRSGTFIVESGTSTAKSGTLR